MATALDVAIPVDPHRTLHGDLVVPASAVRPRRRRARSQGAKDDADMKAPNAVSLLRIPLAAAFVLVSDVRLRAALVALSAFSDWLDGAVARRTGSVTRSGELLDPIADRVFMVTSVVTLAVEGALPVWTVPLLLLRDIGVLFGAGVALAMNPVVRLPARRGGKRVTWLQFAAVLLLLFQPGLTPWIVPPIAALGAAALIDYAAEARRQLRREGRRRGSA